MAQTTIAGTFITGDSVTASQIAANAITNAELATTAITSQTAETTIAGDDVVLIYDTSASAFRKMTRTNFVAGIGGTTVNGTTDNAILTYINSSSEFTAESELKYNGAGNLYYSRAGTVQFDMVPTGGSSQAWALSARTDGTFRITNDTDGSIDFKIDGDGAITTARQPSFIAKLTTAQNNVLGGSGGGALLDLRVANSNWSIIEERGECFNDGTFTAPVTGLYLVHCFISLGGLASTNTYSNLWLDTDTPHGNLQITSEHAWNGAYTPSGERPIRWSALMEFDANDTAYISGHIYYGSTVIDVQVNTYFSAMLVA